MREKRMEYNHYKDRTPENTIQIVKKILKI